MRAVLRDLIEHRALTTPDLAALRSVTRQGVQPVVDELVKAGLAVGRPNPRHKRSPLIAATEKGHLRYQEMRASELAALQSVALEFDAQKLAITIETLRAVSNALKQQFPEGAA